MICEKKKTAFEQLIALDDCSTKHRLSAIYQIVLNLASKPNVLNIGIWEKDCNTKFTDQAQESLHKTHLTTTNILPIHQTTISLVHNSGTAILATFETKRFVLERISTKGGLHPLLVAMSGNQLFLVRNM